MGIHHSKGKHNISNTFSPSGLNHYQEGKPEFLIENTITTIVSSSSKKYSLFSFPCIHEDNSKNCDNNLSENWKECFIRRCNELENTTFWNKKIVNILKKFHDSHSEVYFLEQLKLIEPPTKMLFEKKRMDFLESSLIPGSILNEDNDKSSIISPSENSKKKFNNNSLKKRIKKILSRTEILDESFQENFIKSEFMRPISINQNLPQETKKSNKYLDEYKLRTFSFEYSDTASTNSLILERNNNIKISKESSHFKNNTFVIDYQTFLSNLNDPNEEKNLNNGEKYFFIKHYKQITEKIEIHLKNIQNPLGYIFLNFVILFENEYENKMIFYDHEKGNREKYIEIYEEAIFNIKSFIRIFQEILFLYYNLRKHKEPDHSIFLFTKDNLINFMTSLVFENDYIYEYLFVLQKNIDTFKEIIIKKSIEKLKNFKPCDFGINERLSLNDETITFLRNLKKNSGKKNESINFNTLNEKDDITSNFYQPYKKAIKNLKKIENVKSPLHKLKIVLKCAESIMKSIRSFYAENDAVFTDNISGDEILTIFIYIINKANVPFLISHCNFIEKFITSQLSFSISGYYFYTIIAAVNYIENMY